MTATPLRNEDVFELPETNIVNLDGLRAPVQTPAAVLSNPDALSEDKPKKGRPKGSKSKPKKKKKAKAATGDVYTTRMDARGLKQPADMKPVPETKTPIMSLRVAAGGEGMLNRFRRIKPDVWVWVGVLVAGVSLGIALAFLTGVVKL